MSATCMKRLLRERERFPKDQSEFFVAFKDDDIFKFEAYIVAPEDSLYKFKLVKLKFEIPSEYPIVPPKVTFIQHSGDRIHPNLYAEGKVCLSILGTYSGDPWSFAMTIESLLIQIRALLDNKPYTHEPNQGDHPEFNKYVRYNTWQWLLLDYLDRESDPEAKIFLQEHLRKHGAEMIEELERQKMTYGSACLLYSPYTCSHSRNPDYDSLLARLKRQIDSLPACATPLAQKEPEVAELKDHGKRKASLEPLDNSPPRRKVKQDPEVIDLTNN